MLETWIQWTCNGCGETEYFMLPDSTRKEVRTHLKGKGWRSYGTLDYCPECVRSGAAKRRETSMLG